MTGISTGALIAPFAFLGPQYDDADPQFYTPSRRTTSTGCSPVRGLFVERWPTTPRSPRQIDEVADPADSSPRSRPSTARAGGCTSARPNWRAGGSSSGTSARSPAAARPGDRELIKQVLLGSAAIPGFFPPSKIPVTVDGRQLHRAARGRRDVAGRCSSARRTSRRSSGRPRRLDLAGTDLYMIVAGKLYADAEPLRKRSLTHRRAERLDGHLRPDPRRPPADVPVSC